MSAHRRRTPTPSPSKDWCAVAAPRPRAEPGPPAGASPTDAPAAPDDVELVLRADGHGPRVKLVTPVVFREPEDLRHLTPRLHKAANALGGHTGDT